MATEDNGFGHQLLSLRKQRGWSQPELEKKVGTSGAIIGCYVRSEITPSIEVAKKLADAFGVTLDYLVDDKELPNILQNKAMLARRTGAHLSVMDNLLRDAKARHTYRMSA